MTNTAKGILIGYTALSLIGITVGLIVFRSTRVGFRVRAARRHALERRESMWGIAVIVFLLAVLGGTIFQVPYFESTKAAPGEQRLAITGRQFAWTIDPPRVHAHRKTLITLKAVDVSHAVGIYDPHGKLLQQLNILPKQVQKFAMTFPEAGTYKLRCLEFCGLDHHLMEGNLVVTR